MLRQVVVYERKQDTNTGVYKKTRKGIARFHAYGIFYEECRDGVGQYSTAIVEFNDGRIDNVPLDLIQFTSLESYE